MEENNIYIDDTSNNEEHLEENGFSWERMLGVALLGAISSASLYYIYTQLTRETKDTLKSMLMDAVKTKMQQLTSKE